MLAVHKKWHDERYPKNHWYFPCRTRDDDNPVDAGGLGHALRRLYEKKLIKKFVTPHGLRAYYVRLTFPHPNGVIE
jgi:hypothetical protein